MISPAIKPRVAFKPISRGLIVAAKNSVNKVQESTQKISKGLNKNEKFAMNYVQFFGSKKTTKILKKNLKSIKESLMSTFAMAKTLKKNVGGMAKGGFLGGALGILGKGLLGGLLGKLALVTLIGIATGGIGYLLYRNAPEFFKFLREKRDQLAPIIEGLVRRVLEKFFLSNFAPAGVQELTDDLSAKVGTDIDTMLQANPEMNRDQAVRAVIASNVGDLQEQIETLKEQKKEITGKRGTKDYTRSTELTNQIQLLESGIKFLKTGGKFLNPAVSFLTNERLGGTFYPEGYDNMTTKERLKTVVSYVETSPKNLDLLDYQVSQSAAMRGGSESKVRFYEDVKNYIDAKRKGEEKDFIENKQVLPEIFDVDATRKENIEEFNKRFNNVTNSKSSNKNKNNINIIQSGTSNNQNAGGGSKDTKISSTPPDSGMINLPFYSPLDSDLAMERGAAKNLYNVYMG
tara:strand:- start:2166 stop:3545 length:1380 start_codon:yes stop_codon:yes gene_type:complete